METENEAVCVTDDFSTIWITRFALCIHHIPTGSFVG